jgi:hypothetical protein
MHLGRVGELTLEEARDKTKLARGAALMSGQITRSV